MRWVEKDEAQLAKVILNGEISFIPNHILPQKQSQNNNKMSQKAKT